MNVIIRFLSNEKPLYIPAHDRRDRDDDFFYSDDGQRHRKSALIEVLDPKYPNMTVFTVR